MMQRVNEALAAALEERGLDSRSCYTLVTSQPPDGWAVEVECSDAVVAQDLVARLALAGDEARRLKVVPLPSPGLPPGLVAVDSVAPVRRTPAHTAEMVSQIVCGDPVTPLKQAGEWFLVRLDDGYIGWIPGWHLFVVPPDAQADYRHRAAHRVAVNHGEVLSAPAPDALPVTDLVVGTGVVASGCGKRGWRAVELPDGKKGFMRAAQLEEAPRQGSVSRERLARTGLKFLGIPYLWGGTTPKGFDCSGLVQRVFRLNGVLLPRDSDQQALVGREKRVERLEDLAVGDLVFFGRLNHRITHVGMVLPDRLFLHAYGQVRVNSLDPAHSLFHPVLARDWRSTRDPLRSG